METAHKMIQTYNRELLIGDSATVQHYSIAFLLTLEFEHVQMEKNSIFEMVMFPKLLTQY